MPTGWAIYLVEKAGIQKGLVENAGNYVIINVSPERGVKYR